MLGEGYGKGEIERSIPRITIRYEAAVTFGRANVAPCIVEVLKPSWRIMASYINIHRKNHQEPPKSNLPMRSAFCRGLARAAAKTLLVSLGSVLLYALTAIMGVFVFLLLVLLIYRAAPSPSTIK